MKEFCKWFEKKTGFIALEWMNLDVENWKTNLIGHMIEYLFIKHNADLIEMVVWSVIEDIDKLYSDLEFTINSLDE